MYCCSSSSADSDCENFIAVRWFFTISPRTTPLILCIAAAVHKGSPPATLSHLNVNFSESYQFLTLKHHHNSSFGLLPLFLRSYSRPFQTIYYYGMEPRTYIPNNRHNDPENMSRMQRDLSSSTHQEDSPGEKAGSLMLRRTLGRVPHICIVGAGISGLRCADVLSRHGAQVTILEGRDRVGGRVNGLTHELYHVTNYA
jgi:hypothetical protein